MHPSIYDVFLRLELLRALLIFNLLLILIAKGIRNGINGVIDVGKVRFLESEYINCVNSLTRILH